MNNLLPIRKNFQPDKALPGELIYRYRARLGLTQAKLAELLGLKSGRMILNWEGGLSLPSASKVKLLLEVFIRRQAFVKGQELGEALQLWQTVKDYHDASNSNYLLFPQPDRPWLEALIKEMSVVPQPEGVNPSSCLTPTDPTGPVPDPYHLSARQNLPSPSSFNLPKPISELIGRETVLEKAITLLRKPKVRFLTITGTGGTGKTRLALEVATRLLPHFPDGIYFVELAATSSVDPVFLLSTIAKALKIPQASGEIRPSLEEKLNTFLSNRQTLLVLDNFEHLLPAGPALLKLLRFSPGLKLLVTSRELLQLYGEYELPLPPLQLPSKQQQEKQALQELAENPAIRLFMERAEAAAPDFTLTKENVQAIAGICVCLDGLPLALELIAPRVKLYPPTSLLQRLLNANSARLNFLEGGPLNFEERQRTLRNSLRWSYSLLNPEEKKLFSCLGVFRGGFSLAAVYEICNGSSPLLSPHPGGFLDTEDHVLSLVHKNLVRNAASHSIQGFKKVEEAKNIQAVCQEARKESGFSLARSRYEMLEIIREFAVEKLAENEEQAVLQLRHARFFLELATQADLHFTGPDQVEWMEQLEMEKYNLEAAINWSLQQDEREAAELGLQIAVALGRFWRSKGYLAEGQQFFEKTLTKNLMAAPNLKAKALNWEGVLALDQGNYQHCLELFQQSLVICREHSIKPGMAAMLNAIGLVATQYLGDYARAKELFEESLSLMEETGNLPGKGNVLNNMGIAAQYQGNLDEAASAYTQSLAIHRQLGNKRDVGGTLNNLGEVSHLQSYDREAGVFYSEALEIFQELGDPQNIAICLEGLAFVLAAGREREAVSLLGIAAALRARVGGVLPGMELADYEKRLETLRLELGQEEFARAWQTGQSAGLAEILVIKPVP